MSKLPENWESITFKGPSGRWIFARNNKVRKQLVEKGEVAVFTRKELLSASPLIKTMSAKEKNEWLSQMISIKEVLPGAEIKGGKNHGK